MSEHHPILDDPDLWSYRRVLCGLALDLLGDEHRAEDVVQQAWVAALQRPPGTVAATRAWLRGVVRNIARTTRGREARRVDVEQLAVPAPPPLEDANQGFELQHDIASALRALPEPYRSTLHQRYFLDLDPEEIALRAGLAQETVKTRLRRGLALLRVDLDRRRGGHRELWAAPLAGLLRTSPPPAVTSSASAGKALLGGTLSMKILGIAALSIAGVGGILLATRVQAPEPPALAVPDDSPSVPSVAQLSRPSDRASVRQLERSHLAGEATPSGGSDSKHDLTGPLVTLRVIEQGGVALEGVGVSIEGGRPIAHTGTDGQTELSLPTKEFEEHVLSFFSPDHLPLRAVVRPPTEYPAHLGTFTLVRGGTVSGVVLDELLLPVPRARVTIVDPRVASTLPGFDVVSRLDARLTTLTDERGRFLLRGIAAGPVRIQASAAGFLEGSSIPLEVQGGRDSSGVELRLRTAPGEGEIAGQVRPPDGLAPQVVSVWFRYTSSEGVRTRRTPTDDHGRFRIRLEESCPHDLWATEEPTGWDHRQGAFLGTPSMAGWRGRVAEGIAPGTTDLVLSFEVAPRIDVTATDLSGGLLEDCELEVLEYSGRDLTEQVRRRRLVQLPIEIDAPSSTFVVAATREGHGQVSLGPFRPEAPPEALCFELPLLPPTTGTITAEGALLPGAVVELFRAGSGRHRIVRRGFLQRMHGELAGTATSDANGVYHLTVRSPGSYFLIASAPGWAAAEIGPLPLGPSGGASGLDLALTRGGSIEGRLLVPADQDPGGWIVGASRGDPFPRTVTVDVDGNYRLDGLTPGPWLVQVLPTGSESTSLRSSRTPVVWTGNCEVVEAEVTRMDLDLSRGTTFLIRGQLELIGEDLTGARVELRVNEGTLGRGQRVDGALLSSAGKFELLTPRPGSYRLLIETDDTMLLRTLEIEHSETEWSERIEVGELVGQLSEAQRSEGTQLVWITGEGGSLAAARLALDETGTFAARVPAGSGRVHYRTQGAVLEGPMPTWPVLGGTTVLPGQTTSFDERP